MINRFQSGYRLKGTLANSEDPDEMQHWVASGSALFAKIKTTFKDRTKLACIHLTYGPFKA